MRNSYIAAGVIILLTLALFIFNSRKTEAPVEQKTESNSKEVLTALPDGFYKIDTSSSFIGWKGEKISGSFEEGTLKLSSGELNFENGAVKEGRFVMDMKSIDNNPRIDRLIEHLKSEDFFAVERFPEAVFVLKKIEAISEESSKEGRFVFAGDLTIKGITKPISFTAEISKEAGDENTVLASASFAINRADWEIKYNSPTFFGNLGDSIIRDAVSITIDLKAQKVIQ